MDVNREMCTCGGAAQLLGDSLELGFASAEGGYAPAGYFRHVIEISCCEDGIWEIDIM